MKRVAVFCGSNNGILPIYREGAVELGKEIAKRGITLIYGGGNVGLMGTVADSALESGGYVVGVIPEMLVERERSHPHLSELIVVSSMHDRKRKMADLADAFIALPGGPGTLEEFFEAYTWCQLGIHCKPCGILNIGNYYDQLISFFNHMNEQQFLKDEHRSFAFTDNDPVSLLDTMNEYVQFQKRRV
ncbi:LOG family protein YvdD [compost metagenome]